MKYLYGWYTKDGHLNQNEGRIVIFKNQSMASTSPSMDHNYLLRAMASRYNLRELPKSIFSDDLK